jgi:hypothetical protein
MYAGHAGAITSLAPYLYPYRQILRTQGIIRAKCLERDALHKINDTKFA